MCRYDIVFAGDYNCYPDDRLADWFPVPENRPESVMRCACVALTSQRGVVLIKHVSSSRRIRGASLSMQTLDGSPSACHLCSGKHGSKWVRDTQRGALADSEEQCCPLSSADSSMLRRG